jgi:hypothetical protein
LVEVTRDLLWRKCVGGSRNPLTGTAFNKQLILPRLAIDRLTKDIYVALSTNKNKPEGSLQDSSKVQIWRQLASAGTASAFVKIFEPPSVTEVVHDEWAPALSVYHVTGSSAKIAISWRSTAYDIFGATHSNARINRLANMSTDGGATFVSPAGWNVDGLSTPVAPSQELGSYDGIDAAPWIPQTFEAAWADPRQGNRSTVYGAAFYQ